MRKSRKLYAYCVLCSFRKYITLFKNLTKLKTQIKTYHSIQSVKVHMGVAHKKERWRGIIAKEVKPKIVLI